MTKLIGTSRLRILGVVSFTVAIAVSGASALAATTISVTSYGAKCDGTPHSGGFKIYNNTITGFTTPLTTPHSITMSLHPDTVLSAPNVPVISGTGATPARPGYFAPLQGKIARHEYDAPGCCSCAPECGR